MLKQLYNMLDVKIYTPHSSSYMSNYLIYLKYRYTLINYENRILTTALG